MANTQKYLNHLLQNTGITPACSEEERAAADIIAKTFADHGFAPEVQEFSASGSAKVVQAVLGIVAFLGAVLAGIGGAVGIIGLLLTIAAAVLFTMERTGKPVLSQLGAGGLSQNVIAYHKASGPLASPRNRPVVVVAHYDSPRADLLCQEPYVSYRPMLVKLLPYAMLAPAVLALVRLLPVPDAAKVILWVLAIIAALVPLANAIAIIANRFVLPYTTGSVCNKSSVAAMLGVMDAVSPYQGHGEEFPQDVPFEEYFAEQRRAAEEAAAAAAAAVAAETAYPHELAEDEVPEGEADGTAENEDAAEAGIPAVGDAAEGVGVDAAASGAAPADADEQVVAEAEDEEPAAGADKASTFTVVDAPSPDSTVAINMADVLDAASVAAATAVAVEETASGTTAPAVPVAPVAAPATQAVADEPATKVEPEPVVANEPSEPSLLNAEGNYRFGEDAIRSLGMLPDSCAIVYERDEEAEEPERDEPELTAFDVEPAVDDWQPAPVVEEEPEPYDEEEYAEDESAFYPEEDGAVDQDDSYVSDDSDESDDAEPIDVAPEDVQETAYDAEEPADASDDDEPARFYDPDATSFIMAAIDIEQLDDEPADASADGSAELDANEDTSDTAIDATVEQPALDLEAGNTVAAAPVEPASDDEEPVEEAAEVESEDAPEVETTPESDDRPVDEQSEGNEDPESTQMFSASPEVADDPSHTIAMPAAPVETVDSLMAEISNPAPTPAVPVRVPQVRSINVPSTADAPVPRTPDTANRASLFDLPDPSATPADPFASPGAAVPAQNPPAPEAPEALESSSVVDRVSTISAPAPAAEQPRRGLGRLFGRKKKQSDSMSEWLGVDEDYDAKTSGSDIGSWDNFEDDDTGWKGGATGADGLTEADLREAITSMGDDELLGHDIWFVATGASENGNAGIKAFLREHRDKLRGVFLINLECVGAGQVAMVSTEGERRVLKGDKRIMKLVSRVSADFHHEYGALDMPYVTTDAHAAMSMSLRSLTIAGVEGAGFALGHTEEDQPYNVDPDNIALVSDVVTEVIRRS